MIILRRSRPRISALDWRPRGPAKSYRSMSPAERARSLEHLNVPDSAAWVALDRPSEATLFGQATIMPRVDRRELYTDLRFRPEFTEFCYHTLLEKLGIYLELFDNRSHYPEIAKPYWLDSRSRLAAIKNLLRLDQLGDEFFIATNASRITDRLRSARHYARLAYATELLEVR